MKRKKKESLEIRFLKLLHKLLIIGLIGSIYAILFIQCIERGCYY